MPEPDVAPPTASDVRHATEALSPAEVRLIALARDERDRAVRFAEATYKSALQAVKDSHRAIPPGLAVQIDLDNRTVTWPLPGPRAVDG